MNSSGSALEENARWMDSIEGKTYQFTNALQTMWSNMIDSEVVKSFIDFGTNVIKFLDTVPGKVTALVAAFAGVAKFKGFSLMGLGKDAISSLKNIVAAKSTLDGLGGLNLTGASMDASSIQAYATAVRNLTANQQAHMLSAQGLTEAQIKLALQYNNMSDDVIREATAHIFAKQSKDQEKLSDQELLANKILLSAASLKLTGDTDALAAAEFLEANASKLAASADAEQIIMSSNLSASQKAAALSAIQQSTANMGLAASFKALWAANPIGMFMTIASTVLSIVIPAYNKLHRSTEEVAKSADEAISKYKETQKSINEQKITADELAASYKQLSSGVNTTTNANIGLTVEAYEEYLDVCNDIADIYPELVAGYDAQGNAILSLQGKVEGLTDSYKKAQEEAANTLLTPQNKKDVWSVYEDKVSNVVESGFTNGGDYYEFAISDQKKILEALQSMTDNELRELYDYDIQGNANMWDVFRNKLSDLGMYYDDGVMMSTFNNLALDTANSFDEYKSLINSKLIELNKDFSGAINGIQETVFAKLIFDPTYTNDSFSDDSKAIVKSIVNNIDENMIEEAKKSGYDGVDGFYEWFSSNIVQTIADTDYQSLFSGVTSISDELADAIFDDDINAFRTARSRFDEMVKEWVDPSTGNIEIDPEADYATQYLQKLAKDIQEQAKNYEVKVQMQTDFESSGNMKQLITKYTGEYQEEIQSAIDELGLGADATLKDVYGHISTTLAGDDGKLFSDELKDLYTEFSNAESTDALKDVGWSDNQIAAIQSVDAMMKLYGTDIDTVKAKLIDLGYVLPSLEDIGSFNLKSESTKEMVETFEENISSIKEAWNSLNDGDMTKSEFIELALEIPEIMDGVDLSSDNWMVQAKKNLEELNQTKIDEFIEKLVNMKAAMEAKGEDTSIVNSFINYANQLKNTPLINLEENTTPDTISDLKEAYESYKTILEETNEVLYDGQKVSEDYYNSLKDYIDDVEALDSCFDKNNKSIVTNAKKLKALIAQQKQESLATTRTARAQSQLQYQELVQELVAATYAYEQNTSAGYDEIESLLEQIDTVRDTIDQYKRLELSLLGATNAYEKFQKAQQLDQDTDYETSISEMIKSMGEGFDSGKVGLEAFNAAIKGILPESVYGNLADPSDLDAVWKEFTTGNLSRFFSYSEDNGFTITLKNAKELVRVAQESGVFTGEGFDQFGVVAGKTLKDVAAAWGVSEDAAYGFMEILTDYSIGGKSLVSELADVKYDAAIEDATDDLAKLAEQKAAMLKSGQYDPEDMQKLNADIKTAQANLDAANKSAISHAQQYTTLAALNNGLNGGIELSQEKMQSLVKQLNLITGQNYTLNVDGKSLIDAKGNVVTVADMLAKLGSQPTVLQIQLAANTVQSQIDALNKEKEKIAKEGITSEVQVKYGTSNTEDVTKKINEQIAQYEEQLDTIEMQYGIKPATEEETSIIEQFKLWETEGINATLKVDTTDATAKRAEIEKPMSTTLTVNTVTGTTAVTGTPTSSTVNFNIGEGYKAALDAIADLSAKCAIPIEQLVEVDDDGTIQVVQGALETLNKYELKNKYLTASISGYSTILSQLNTIISKLQTIDSINAVATISVEGSGSLALGTDPGPVKPYKNSAYVDKKKGQMNNTVFATGSPGLPHAEKGALVGELGPEAVVDPASGTWQTVGNFGAEFVDLPKGAIIFNHLQTQELLKNGHTTRGKMVNGSAFAGGNAFSDPNYTYTKHHNWTGTQDTSDPFGDTYKDLSNAGDDLGDAAEEFAETIDWIEIRMEELEEALGLLSAQLENAADIANKNNIIDEMIGVNKQKYADSLSGANYYEDYANKYWSQIPSQYRDLAKNGAIAIDDFTNEADEATIEAINKYREYAQKAADLTQQAEDTITAIRDLAIQRIDEAYESGSVRAEVEDSQTEKLQNRVDLDEERGLVTSDAYYIAMMENSNKKIEYLTSARENMQKAFDQAVRNGEIIRGSNEWYETLNEIYGIEAEIAEATIELEEFQNAINDIHWDNFENLTNQIEYLKDKTQSLIDLMEHSGDLVADPEKKKYEGGTVEYWTADDVQWTDEGLASLGLYAQQMEIAEFEARQYAEAIDELNSQYAAGRYSESEYLEKLDELTSAQYDAIDSYYEAQDAIVDLNKTRIDSIKNGIQKEIDAYEELISVKKKELDAEKDLYDFQKNTMQQQKNIADIERKLAALANDNSLSAAAKRKQLEAELAEAQYELQDTYYNRSVEDKQTALDRELEDFQTEKNAELAKWEEYLANVEQVVADSLNVIQANASGIYDTLNQKAQEYDLTLSDSIMSPWKDGALAVSDYQNTFDTAMSSTMNQLEAMKQKWQEVINQMVAAGQATVDTINKQNNAYASATQQTNIRDTVPTVSNKPQTNTQTNTGKTDYSHLFPGVTGNKNNTQTTQPSLTTGSYVQIKSGAKWYSDSYGGGSWGYAQSGTIRYVNNNGTYAYNIDGLGWVKKSDIVGYAKGTISTPKSGLVNVDELGDELILRAQNGRLTYMEKGSGVVPADLTSNLMEWGKLDPTSMIEQNRPSITTPVVQNKEVNIDLTYGDILHIEEFHGDDPDEIAKIVAKQFEKHTKNLNSAIRKFAR